jgi:hypothetical protein
MSSKKQKAPPKKLVYARRSPAGAPRNPQNVLDTAPQGTRDWKRVLHCVLVIHNQEHSKLVRADPNLSHRADPILSQGSSQ